MKSIADNMTCARTSISKDDLIQHILAGLGSDYFSVSTYITGSSMNLDKAYVLLITHEGRME